MTVSAIPGKAYVDKTNHVKSNKTDDKTKVDSNKISIPIGKEVPKAEPKEIKLPELTTEEIKGMSDVELANATKMQKSVTEIAESKEKNYIESVKKDFAERFDGNYDAKVKKIWNGQYAIELTKKKDGEASTAQDVASKLGTTSTNIISYNDKVRQDSLNEGVRFEKYDGVLNKFELPFNEMKKPGNADTNTFKQLDKTAGNERYKLSKLNGEQNCRDIQKASKEKQARIAQQKADYEASPWYSKLWGFVTR